MTSPSARGGFAGAVSLLLLARLAAVASLFGIHVIGARLLTPELLGSAAVGQTVGMIAALVANGGLNIATIYFLRQHADRREELVPRLVALAIGSCVLAIAIVVVAAPLMLGWVVPESAWPLMLAAALLGAAIIGFEFAGALLLGLGRTGWFAAVELVRGVGALVAVGILLLGPWRDDTGFVAGLTVGYALAAALGIVTTSRAGMPIRPSYDRAVIGRALRFGVRGQAGNVFQFLGVRLDLLLVPALLDLRAAGLYLIAVRVSDVVGQVATAASSLVFPRVADPSERASTELTERATRMSLLVVGAAAIVLGLAGEAILGVFFGDVYTEGVGALLVLLAAALPLALGRIISADLKGRGRPGLASWASLLMVAAIVVLDLILIPAYGITGAAAASLLAYTIGAGALVFAYRSVAGGQARALVPTWTDVREVWATARQVVFGPSPRTP